jgi:hypothetical protein
MAVTFLLASVYCCLLAVGWLMTLLALPGNWLIVAVAAGYASLIPAEETRLGVSWQTVIVLAALAVVGELVELSAASRGVRQAGGSRSSAFLALVGSIIGAFVGVFAGIPIPFIGPLVAAVVFGGMGAAAGAMLGERFRGRSFDATSEVGWAAFLGRLKGTLAKTLVGSVMVAVGLAALVLN